MYDITDKKNPTRELQEYLRALSHTAEGMPHTPIDGFFGETTAEAVRVFQEQNGLPVTGEVGYLDWQAIYASYLQVQLTEKDPLLLPPSRLPMKRDSRGEEVVLLQTLLAAVGAPLTHVTGHYSAETERAVREYQASRLLPVTGELDLTTWEALCEDYRLSEHSAEEDF